MKNVFTLLFIVIAFTTTAQDKYNYVAYNTITELQGTTYVMASVSNRSKISSENSRSLLFINTVTGDNKQIDFPKNAFIEKVEQIKIDSLKINKVVVAANTVNLDGNKSIDWNDPQQIIVLSTDGNEKYQITEDRFFASHWQINRQTGVIVVTGHYDTNSNGKYDKTDKHEILLYDLKTMRVIKRL